MNIFSPKWVLAMFCLLASFACGTIAFADKAESKDEESRFAWMRQEMVKTTIRQRGIRDQEVLRAMETVKRHLFVPPHLIDHSYADGPLPIGYGQTISQPYIVAAMTELIDLETGGHVLEVGTGSGYQAAVLAEIIEDVYTIEIIPELGKAARSRLEKLGYKNVHVEIGDGYFGWEAHAPYDGIIVTAAATHIPPPLIEQLKPGGRMVIPVGPVFHVQYLMLVEKRKDGTMVQRKIMPVRFVPLTGGEK